MIKISEAVEKILMNDEIAIEGLRFGILNLSAYAEKIRSQVENYCKKPIKVGTIVVSVMRFAKQLENLPNFKPNVILQDINIKSPIYEITCEYSEDILRKLSVIEKEVYSNRRFLTLTQGLDEITILFSEDLKDIIKNKLDGINVEISHLAAITARFTDKYINEPNIIYTLVSSLALQRINIIEIVSTYTQIIFIVRTEEMTKTIEVLNKFLTKE